MAEDTNNIEDKQKDYEQHFRVALFGSARIKKDDKIHKDVYELSRLIAGANIDIVTGGGPGLMLAANQGH
ncbi:MAG: LOG family protein, partial [Candidatus Thermoplasmatota archaeon]|nr:LOG family protein [Candidatus Thermoplasmatota archaeon]